MSLPEHPKVKAFTLFIVASVSIAQWSFFIKTLLMAYKNELNVLSMAGIHVQPQNMTTFPDKLQFTAKYWTPGLIWLLSNIILVIFGRLTTGAVVPNTKIEYKVANQRNILTQTIEQLTLAVFTQMAVLPYLTATQVMNIIPLLNIYFFIGRVIFWLGYPWYRTPGVGFSMYPHMLTMIFLLASFLAEHKILFLSTVLDFVK